MALLLGIAPICIMELWQNERLLVHRDVEPEFLRERAEFDPETDTPYSTLEDLDRRIQDCEQSLILARADVQRLKQANLASDLAEDLMYLLSETLDTMIEYRHLLIASLRDRKADGR